MALVAVRIPDTVDAVELFHGAHRDEVMPNERSLLRVIDNKRALVSCDTYFG